MSPREDLSLVEGEEGLEVTVTMTSLEDLCNQDNCWVSVSIVMEHSCTRDSSTGDYWYKCFIVCMFLSALTHFVRLST